MAIHLCGSPGSVSGRAALSLLNLAPDGVCRASPVARVAGALLPHRFTLTCATRRRPSAVCSLWHFPAGHPGWPLASILPCGAPTFRNPLGEPSKPRPPGQLTVADSMAWNIDDSDDGSWCGSAQEAACALASERDRDADVGPGGADRPVEIEYHLTILVI